MASTEDANLLLRLTRRRVSVAKYSMKRRTAQTPKSLTLNEKKRIAHSAGRSDAPSIVTELARSQLTGPVHNRTTTSAHLELLLIHVAAGATVKAICWELGISSGAVYQRAIDDETFAGRLHAARKIGAQTLFDTMLEVAWNAEEGVERSRLKVQVLDRLARTFDRSLSDRQQIDVRTMTAYVLPPDADEF